MIRLIVLCLIAALMINTIIEGRGKPAEKTKARIVRFVMHGILAILLIWYIAGDYVKENYMFFKSPEAAFRAVYLRSPDVIIMGEESAYVFTHNGAFQVLSDIALKSEKGWWIDDSRTSTWMHVGMHNEYRMVEGTGYSLQISVVTPVAVEDYYVRVNLSYAYLSGEKPIVYDECDSEFIVYLGSWGCTYYAYIKDYDGLYTIYVNDEAYELEFDAEKRFWSEYHMDD